MNGVFRVLSVSALGVVSVFASAMAQDISEAPAGAYAEDPNHAYISFSYDHAGFSYPFLRWRNFDAALNLDPADPENSSVNVTIDANSIDSGVDEFDGHLKGERFFHVAEHPEITFVSTKLTKISDTTGTLTGDLMMKGVTKPVTLDVTFNKVGENRQGKPLVGFSARGAIKRSEWDLGFGTPRVGDEVKLIIETEFVKAD